MPTKLRVAEMPVFEREVKKYPWVAYCAEPTCYFIVSAKDEDQGQASLDAHKCPYGGSSERIPDKVLMSAIWRELDACMDGIMLAKAGGDGAAEKMAHYKSRAGGIATCLFIVLGGPPGYYVTQEDISREALRRYKMRLGELEWEPTVGDSYDPLRDGATPHWEAVVWEMKRKGQASRTQIDPPPNKSTPEPRKKRRVAAPPPNAGFTLPTAPLAGMPGMGLPGMTTRRKLPDDVVTGIRNALASKMDVQTIASIFQVDVSDVKTLQGE